MRIRSSFALLLVIVLLLAGCGKADKRDTLPLERALQGHWVAQDGLARVDLYFSSNTFIMAVGDRTLEFDYNVAESDPKQNSLRIEIGMGFTDAAGYPIGADMILKFSRNKRSISVRGAGPGGGPSGKWKYVDSKTEP